MKFAIPVVRLHINEIYQSQGPFVVWYTYARAHAHIFVNDEIVLLLWSRIELLFSFFYSQQYYWSWDPGSGKDACQPSLFSSTRYSHICYFILGLGICGGCSEDIHVFSIWSCVLGLAIIPIHWIGIAGEHTESEWKWYSSMVSDSMICPSPKIYGCQTSDHTAWMYICNNSLLFSAEGCVICG